jgi:hypothetical protein
MPRRNTGQIYTVNVYEKGQDTIALVWEGKATNLTDAFTQARDAYDPRRFHGTLRTLLVGRRDHDKAA